MTRGKGKKIVKAYPNEEVEDVKKIVKAYPNEEVEDVKQNSAFGRYSDLEIIAWLKGLALDPCKPQFAQGNMPPSWNQILSLRKVMVLKDSEIPWRKRKLEQFVKDKLMGSSGFAVSNQQNRTKQTRRELSHASSASCLLNSEDSVECHDKNIVLDSRSSSSLLTFEDTLLEKQVLTECSFQDDAIHWDCPTKDISLSADSDESVIGSNPLSPENLTPNEAPSLEINNAIHHLNLPALDGTIRRHLRPASQPINLVNVISDHFQRNVIPVGFRFQADVPKWSGSVNMDICISEYNSDSDNLKWLGTRVWPVETGKMKTTGRKIGKGRSNSCSCLSPGSVNCIRRHVLEERLLLQCDLGPAFFSWKFDEMGEQVSKLWALKEQQTFESLVKAKIPSKGKDFLKRALKCLSNKCRKDIINYYFNVYIPQRMSLQTRSSPVVRVDTDDEEEEENFNYMGLQKRCEGRTLIINNSKDVKARYLRRDS